MMYGKSLLTSFDVSFKLTLVYIPCQESVE
jgi:hypothetical protein